MKSDKAEDYLINHECGYPMDGYVPLMEAGRAVEIAEQDAEKRMRQKAIEAFDDMWFSGFEPDYEYHRMNFIKKLNEE